MIIIADSSALVSLAVCDSLSLLEPLFGEIYVPKAVYNEVCISGKVGSDLLEDFLQSRTKVITLDDFTVFKPEGLGYGELEAMALYESLAADLLLIDDARAKKIAYMNGMEVMGSLGVLLLAKQRGLITQLSSRLKMLSVSELYFDDAIIQKILELAGENTED